jgi:hypothetical protein
VWLRLRWTNFVSADQKKEIDDLVKWDHTPTSVSIIFLSLSDLFTMLIIIGLLLSQDRFAVALVVALLCGLDRELVRLILFG